MNAVISDQVLTQDMLQGFAKRVAIYDRENRFFHRGLRGPEEGRLPDHRRAARSWAGAASPWPRVCREQRRLAYHAPATALAINMHLYWVGIAADLWRRATSRWSGS